MIRPGEHVKGQISAEEEREGREFDGKEFRQAVNNSSYRCKEQTQGTYIQDATTRGKLGRETRQSQKTEKDWFGAELIFYYN